MQKNSSFIKEATYHGSNNSHNAQLQMDEYHPAVQNKPSEMSVKQKMTEINFLESLFVSINNYDITCDSCCSKHVSCDKQFLERKYDSIIPVNVLWRIVEVYETKFLYEKCFSRRRT